MKKILFSLFLMSLSITFYANPGDTTWVTAFNQRKMTYTGAYDTLVSFPTSFSSNKVLMYLTIGRYSCPGNPQYCGSWDYTFDIILKPQGNDTVQIGKYITPYATNWVPGVNKHEYVIDVTDYAKLMNGTNGLQFIFDGYSFGFTSTIKFAFIEGTPYQNVIDVKRIYKRNYYYFGSVPNQIENQLTNNAVSTGSNISRSIIKNYITGHGSDNSTYCLEFCAMSYSLLIDNVYNTSKSVWRNTCGFNQVYPQTGTWIYDRSNWCPGDVSAPYIHDISAMITSNATHSVNINMSNYANASGQACYCLETQLITYSAPTFSSDVGVEWVYGPNSDDDAVRDNPTCSNPHIVIKNYGSNNLTSAIITYSINNVAAQSFTWTGNLPYLDTLSLWLPGSSTIFPTPSSTNNIFAVNATTNGDQNIYNNKMYTYFEASAQYQTQKMIIDLITNASMNGPYSESRWYMYDENNNLIAQRINMNANTFYSDTVTLTNACYKLILNDDGCDGISWWANSAAGNGTFRIKDGNSNVLKYYNGDFGCQLTDRFSVNTIFTGLHVNKVNESIDIFPNPFNSTFNIQFSLANQKQVKMRILSIDGKALKEEIFSNALYNTVKIDVKELPNGIYFAELTIDGVKQIKKIVKQE